MMRLAQKQPGFQGQKEHSKLPLLTEHTQFSAIATTIVGNSTSAPS
ncbi:hypothetical protein [Paenibacillus odorifer]|nr:hypothetical protein [Paenibacillus odorifer]